MKILYLPSQYSQQRQRQKKAWVYPVRMAMEAQWHRNQGHDVTWGSGDVSSYDKVITGAEGLPFLDLPAPDRVFTNALDKKYQLYGNYKYRPATHIACADGCWHGKCSFCVENGKKYVVRDLLEVREEIDKCEELGFKEIFDDSGTFPDGPWLEMFCKWMYDTNFPKLGCNMRIGADVDFDMMKAANFRMLLFGIESANQYTLDRINKGVDANDIIPTIKKASEAGLEPHIAVIFGYPWETEAQERNTLDLVHYLLRKGYAKTAQASIYRVPGECSINRGFVDKIYDVAVYPEFWFNKIRDIKNFEDFLYLLKGIRKGIVRD